MRIKKTLQELTITSSFLFAAVMVDPENCKGLLERILEIEIDHIEVITEKSMIYHPEYKGVRLDVFAKDENNTRFNVEMQVKARPVTKRSRYYHSQMDMDMLQSGLDYRQLPDSYVIFICDYDPFGEKKYRYTLQSTCKELPDLQVDDGVHTIILSNRGENESEVPVDLVNFLKFTRATLAESECESDDLYISRLQTSIRAIKNDRLMEDKYMVLEELLKDEREEAFLEGEAKGHAEGKAEGIIDAAIKLLEKGLSDNEIIHLLDLSTGQITKAKKLFADNTPKC